MCDVFTTRACSVKFFVSILTLNTIAARKEMEIMLEKLLS